MPTRLMGSDCDRAIRGMGAAPAPQGAGCLSQLPPVRMTRAYHCDRVGFAHERQAARNLASAWAISSGARANRTLCTIRHAPRLPLVSPSPPATLSKRLLHRRPSQNDPLH